MTANHQTDKVVAITKLDAFERSEERLAKRFSFIHDEFRYEVYDEESNQHDLERSGAKVDWEENMIVENRIMWSPTCDRARLDDEPRFPIDSLVHTILTSAAS